MERNIKLEKVLKKLIGYKLMELDDEHLVVSNDIKTYVLNIQRDEGDYDGYNDIMTDSYKEIKPVITNIEVGTKEEENWFGEMTAITFYGVNGVIAKIYTLSSSDSGCRYGAHISISGKELKIKGVISKW